MLQPVRINPPTKGINTITPIRELDHRYAVRLDNVWFDRAGALVRRPGQNSIGSAFPGTIGALFEYVAQSGAATIFAWNSQDFSIYKYSGGAWIKESTAGTYTEAPNAAQMGAQLIIGGKNTLGSTTTMYYNGSAWAVPTGIITTPYDNHCSMFASHNGRMYGAGSSSLQSVVFFSDTTADGSGFTAGVADWTITTTTRADPKVPVTWAGPGGFIDVSGAIGSGEPVTGITSFQGLLTVFTPNAVVFYNITDPLTSFNVAKVVRGVGCITHKSIAHAGNDTIFLSQYGFMKLREVFNIGDAASEATSVPINNAVLDAIRATPATDIRATHAEKLGVYLCRIGSVAWAYHYLFDGWTQWYGIQNELLTTHDGTIYTGTNYLHTLDAANNTDSIDGGAPTSISLKWEPAPFRSSGQEVKTRWNRAEVIYETSGNATINFASWINLDINTQLTNNILIAGNKVIVDPSGMVWSGVQASTDPRTIWWDGTTNTTNWTGTTIAGNELLAGSSVIPLRGRAELLSVSVSNSDDSYLRISALEIYKNEGNVRDG